jgi:hypothetical protein
MRRTFGIQTDSLSPRTCPLQSTQLPSWTLLPERIESCWRAVREDTPCELAAARGALTRRPPRRPTPGGSGTGTRHTPSREVAEAAAGRSAGPPSREPSPDASSSSAGYSGPQPDGGSWDGRPCGRAGARRGRAGVDGQGQRGPEASCPKSAAGTPTPPALWPRSRRDPATRATSRTRDRPPRYRVHWTPSRAPPPRRPRAHCTERPLSCRVPQRRPGARPAVGTHDGVHAGLVRPCVDSRGGGASQGPDARLCRRRELGALPASPCCALAGRHGRRIQLF